MYQGPLLFHILAHHILASLTPSATGAELHESYLCHPDLLLPLSSAHHQFRFFSGAFVIAASIVVMNIDSEKFKTLRMQVVLL